MLVRISSNRVWFSIYKMWRSKAAVIGFFFVRMSAKSFVPMHQCNTLSLPSSSALQSAARPTLLYHSTGPFTDEEKACNAARSTVSSVHGVAKSLDNSSLR